MQKKYFLPFIALLALLLAFPGIDQVAYAEAVPVEAIEQSTVQEIVAQEIAEFVEKTKLLTTRLLDQWSEHGLIAVNYVSSKKGKLTIEKDGQKYTYDLFPGAKLSTFPLQLGPGKYTVKVYEHIEGNRYRGLLQKQLTTTNEDEELVYTHKTQLIDWQDDDEPIVLAAELVKDKTTDAERLAVLHQAVAKALAYDTKKLSLVPAGYLPDISLVWEEGKGICYDYSVVLAAMLRSQGIPAKLVKGYTPNIDGYHAWNEVYLADEERWVIVDVTYDSCMQAGGRAITVEKPAKQYTDKVYEY